MQSDDPMPLKVSLVLLEVGRIPSGFAKRSQRIEGQQAKPIPTLKELASVVKGARSSNESNIV